MSIIETEIKYWQRRVDDTIDAVNMYKSLIEVYKLQDFYEGVEHCKNQIQHLEQLQRECELILMALKEIKCE